MFGFFGVGGWVGGQLNLFCKLSCYMVAMFNADTCPSEKQVLHSHVAICQLLRISCVFKENSIFPNHSIIWLPCCIVPSHILVSVHHFSRIYERGSSAKGRTTCIMRRRPTCDCAENASGLIQWWLKVWIPYEIPWFKKTSISTNNKTTLISYFKVQ